MNLSYVKLEAKNRMVKSNVKCFFAAVMPYAAVAVLAAANYYLYCFLSSVGLEFSDFLSANAVYAKAAVFTASVTASYFFCCLIKLLSESFFYQKTRSAKAGLRSALRGIGFKKYAAYASASLLKFFLSVAWGVFYLLPCAVSAGIAVYCHIGGGYGQALITVLTASAAVLLAVGGFFWYATVKRYAMYGAVILAGEETESLAALERSTELMEGNMLRYAAYSISFFGWILSCVFIIPALYVLPYRCLSRYSFFANIKKLKEPAPAVEKPVIFYIRRQAAD